MENLPILLKNQLDFYFPKFIEGLRDNSDEIKAIKAGISALRDNSLTLAKLNQMLHLCSKPGISQGFFKYYFLSEPKSHPYPIRKIKIDNNEYIPSQNISEIKSLIQLQWGLQRIMHDSLLYFGNFQKAFEYLRQLSYDQLYSLYESKRINESQMLNRGEIEMPTNIPMDNRYLISEMACKTYEEISAIEETEHVKTALNAYSTLKNEGLRITANVLKKRAKEIANETIQYSLELLLEESEEEITSEEEVIKLYSGQYSNFKSARRTALDNTRIYLSICDDLDAYIATSMRTRQDFRDMASTCDRIFKSDELRQFNIRYFDPTLSAANHHEDKGLIECLMVKKAKVLIYFAQHKESLGKISEYAMALSLGKPVIIYCPDDAGGKQFLDFYKEKHPLIRLVEFESGVVHGAIVTNKLDEVILLLKRIFTNQMEYRIVKKPERSAYYLLKETITESTVRIITDDRMLTETFWNYYNPNPDFSFKDT